MRLAALVLLAAGAAHAQYKCATPDGSTTFQQTPCPSGAAETRVGPRLAAPAASPWIAPGRPEHIRRAAAEGRVVVGMTVDEVHRIAGRAPDRANTTATAAGGTAQRVYLTPHRTIYVYSAADVVTGVQVVER